MTDSSYRKKRLWTAGLITLLALLLRIWAAWQLPLDADEPVYLQAAYDYAHFLRTGDLAGIVQYSENSEHPPAVKILYGAVIAALGEGTHWEGALFAVRSVSALLGALAVGLVALFNPAGGFFLAVQTLAVKYTGQAYLEAWPLLGAAAAVSALVRSRRERDRWFWIAAAALGFTAAGKYSYFPVLAVILFVFLLEKKYRFAGLALFLLAAGLVFWSLNPYLWQDPVRRLGESLLFHPAYAQSAHVQQAGYPWYQPLLWVAVSWGADWHPEVFFYFGIDGLIALLALVGIRPALEKGRWVAAWIAAGMLFLLLWPTRWPQYTLVVLPAICIAAGLGVEYLHHRLREAEAYWNWLEGMLPRPGKFATAAGILLLAAVTLGQVLVTARNSWVRRGWQQFTPENSGLPGWTVYDVLPLDADRLVVGSEAGATLVTLSEDTGLPQVWNDIEAADSGFSARAVLDVEADAADVLWLASRSGLTRCQDRACSTIRLEETGLEGEQIVEIESVEDDRIWVGAGSSAALYTGGSWQVYPLQESGTYISALAVHQADGREEVWIGTGRGLFRLDPGSGSWSEVGAQAGLKTGTGIADLLVDGQNRLWAATLGDGLHVWDGAVWTAYRVSNSGLPSNTVVSLVEAAPGVFYIGCANPAEVGGWLARFDGQTWHTYTTGNSGFSGAEPLALVQDAAGRLWIGTRTAGLQVFTRPDP